MSEPVDQAADAPAPAPAPVLAGEFWLYETPDGGYLLVTEVPGRGVERHHVPGQLVRLARSGGAMTMVGRLFGRGKG